MSFLDLLYPPQCLHCKEVMEKQARFCSDCLSLFTLLPKEGFCDRCFSSISTPSGTCKPCRGKRHVMKRLGSCFESFGPAQTLLQTFFRTKNPQLAKEIASLIVFQLDALNFPELDALTMVPNCLFNPQYAIAKEVAKLLQIPFLITLRKIIGVETQFALKSNCNFIDQRLLLIDTEVKTRLTMRSAADALVLGWPQTLYGMTFCAT